MKKDRLKGVSPSITDLNLALYGEMDPDCPRISPEISKQLWESVRPHFDNKFPGMPIIMSTAGEDKCSLFFKQLWDESL